MSKKYKIIFCGIAFALVAIIAGFCLVFFGNKTIKHTPKTLEVQKYDDSYHLVAEFNAGYEYQFKLEQLIDGSYLVVGLVNSKTNSIRLEDSNLNIIAGASYRFSARFANENGRGKGKFCQPIIWSPSWSLESVDYSKVVFEGDVLSWQTVPDAESYSVVAVDENLQERQFVASNTSCVLSELSPGRYTVYVVAESSVPFIEPSLAGDGKAIVVERKNVLSSAHMSSGILTVESLFEVLSFEIYAGDTLLGTVESGDFASGVYRFENFDSLLAGVDLGSTEIKIKSLRNDCILESDFVIVVMD